MTIQLNGVHKMVLTPFYCNIFYSYLLCKIETQLQIHGTMDLLQYEILGNEALNHIYQQMIEQAYEMNESFNEKGGC